MTADQVIGEFSASLDPALKSSGCPVEVYRLEPVTSDVRFSEDDLVVCRIPGWQFDFSALEEMHRQLEDLRIEHDDLMVQYSRTKEALMSFSASVETPRAVEMNEVVPSQRRSAGGDYTQSQRQEVHRLKMQLSQKERRQQETKDTVMALRSQFIQLVDMMSGPDMSKHQCGFEVPSSKKDRFSQDGQSPQRIAVGTAGLAKARPSSHQPMARGVQQTVGSSRVPVSSAARPHSVNRRNRCIAGTSIQQRA